MTATAYYLRRMCKPGVGTNIEIVHTAWQLALEENISGEELLKKVSDQEREAIKSVAKVYVSEMSPDEDVANSPWEDVFAIVGSTTDLRNPPQSMCIPRSFVRALSK